MFTFLFSAIGKVLVWLARQIARLIALLAVQACLHRRTTTGAGAAVASITWLGWQLCLTIAGGVLVSLSTWKAAHPASFGATVGTWTRTWWNKWWIYRRQWSTVMTRCDLTVQAKEEVFLPKLKRVRSTPWWDHLTIELQIGQAQKHVEAQAAELAMAFKSERIVVKKRLPRCVEVALMRRDPLLTPVPATAIPASVEAIDWRRIPVGTDEFGQPYTISLLGGHTAIVGSTGGGKAGLEWNVLRAIGPAIAAGLVRCVFIDPKRKELSQGRQLCAPGDYVGRGSTDLPKDTLALLERLVDEMEAVNDAETDRDYVVGPGRPLTLICIDELIPLLETWGTRGFRDKIEAALRMLLTQGRAAGFIIVAAIQEPTKDIFSIRDLFTRRLALRLPNPNFTDAALIDNAVDFGALCHEIPESLPGVLYSLQDGARSTVRARLGFVQDHDIHELVAYVENAAKVVTLTAWTAGGGKAEIAA